MNKMEFTGVFIPVHIWESKELIPAEKMMLGEIDALSKRDGYCNASRSHFAEWLCCTVQNISYYFSKLESLGFISIEKEPGQRSKIRLVSERFYDIQNNTSKPGLPVNGTDGGGKRDLRVGVNGTDGGGKRDLPEIKEKLKNEIQDETQTAEKKSAGVSIEIFEIKTDFIEAENSKQSSPGRGGKKSDQYEPRDVAVFLEIPHQVFYTNVMQNGSWPDYLDYRRTQHRFRYKDAKSHALAVKNLFTCTGGKPELAQSVVDQSRAKGWTGLFPVKENGNGKQQHVQQQHDLAGFVLANRDRKN